MTTRETPVTRVSQGHIESGEFDFVAVEEPLEIQVGYLHEVRRYRTLTITMRTPGHDQELAAGTLFCERVVSAPDQITAILQDRNRVRVELSSAVEVDWPSLERRLVTSSSCGLCGKVCIDAVQEQSITPLEDGPSVKARVLATLPNLLRARQSSFDRTGGIHAAALFTSEGELADLREDVGRHNAVDKVIGAAFLAEQLPLSRSILLVSGRASFELVQKAIAAGVPLMAAIGAPSSLAVELAESAGMTLTGFVRDNRFNVYSGASRIEGAL